MCHIIIVYSLLLLTVYVQSSRISLPVWSLRDAKPCKKGESKIFRNSFLTATAGAISCSVTHSLVIPLDVIKTKLQIIPLRERMNGFATMNTIIKEDGISGLFRGIHATFLGYFAQGALKFGFYNYFKSKFVSEYDVLHSKTKFSCNSRVFRLVLSSSLAEIIASCALCPLESIKIIIISNPSIANKGFAGAVAHILKTENILGLYKGLPWVIFRQVPYTCMKLVGYEIISNKIENSWIGERIRDANISKMPIQIVSGVLAGLQAAVISQPADVIMSKICASSTQCASGYRVATVFKTVQELGWRGCFAGLQQRAAMVAVLTALQFVLYENVLERIKAS